MDCVKGVLSVHLKIMDGPNNYILYTILNDESLVGLNLSLANLVNCSVLPNFICQ